MYSSDDYGSQDASWMFDDSASADDPLPGPAAAPLNWTPWMPTCGRRPAKDHDWGSAAGWFSFMTQRQHRIGCTAASPSRRVLPRLEYFLAAGSVGTPTETTTFLATRSLRDRNGRGLTQPQLVQRDSGAEHCSSGGATKEGGDPLLGLRDSLF